MPSLDVVATLASKGPGPSLQGVSTIDAELAGGFIGIAARGTCVSHRGRGIHWSATLCTKLTSSCRFATRGAELGTRSGWRGCSLHLGTTSSAELVLWSIDDTTFLAVV